MSQWQTMLAVVLTVFAVMAIGAMARRVNWLTEEADKSLIHLVVRILFPALILKVILESTVLTDARNIYLPPLIGFLTVIAGFAVAALAARLAARSPDLAEASQRRTFAFCIGIYNYSYIPVPLVTQLFHSANTLAVLFVFNVGVEIAFWTIGILLLSGRLGGKWYRQVLNAPSIAIAAAVVLKFSGAASLIPGFAMQALGMMGAAAIPLSLLLVGATIDDEYEHAQMSRGARVMSLACLLRLGLLPVLFLAIAWALPGPVDLKRVIVIQAAMPAAVFPVIVSRHYGGHPATAVRVVLATAIISLLTIPLWLSAGLHLLKIAQ